MSDRPPTLVNREQSDRISGDAVQPPPDSGDPRLSFRWSNYEVVKKLGEGAMGAVYLMQHRTWTARRLAVKFLHPTPNADIVARFRQEALVAAQIQSPRIVKPLDEGQLPDGTLYYIMEFVEGRSVADEIAAGPLSAKDAVQIGARISEAFIDIHAAKVVHRDLKPPNVYLTRAGSRDRLVKILDFGVAKVGGQLKQVGTQAGMTVGTPGYMAPEANGAETDYRADVYSLGVILFELLTGKLPIPLYENWLDTLDALMHMEPPLVRKVRPAHLDPVPPELEALIHRMLAKYPSDRPQEMTEVLAALDRIYEGFKQAAASGVPGARMPTQLSTTVPPPGMRKPSTKADPSVIEGMLDRLGAPRAQIPTGAGPLEPARAVAPPPSRRRRAVVVAAVGGAAVLACAIVVVGVLGVMRGSRTVEGGAHTAAAPALAATAPAPIPPPNPTTQRAAPQTVAEPAAGPRAETKRTSPKKRTKKHTDVDLDAVPTLEGK
jgi:eukaryotic-like serine/threonine-protein kinase